MPKTSIIIVSYNGLNETTAPCLDSIFRCCPENDYEVIVVDNDSRDGTGAYLSGMMEREPRLKCILNGTNRGFAGGNNDGLKIASGEFIILLNSDCLVTPNWIAGLIEPLSRDRSIGLAGPVSNSVGNEQQIFTEGRTPDEIIEEGRRWSEKSGDGAFETDRLIFFCVALRRDVLEKVGPLDEDFGTGFYEDDDYCIRVKKAGYRLVCIEDVFVYHRGGGSFDLSGTGTHEILRKNRGILAQKHTVFIDRIHPRMLHVKVIEGYLDQAAGSSGRADLQYRISNRMRVIQSRLPRGPIKKLKFYWLLRGLKKRLTKLGFQG